MLNKSIKEESLYIADMIIYHNKHISTAYCSLCLGINGTWCGEIHAQQNRLCVGNPLIISLGKVSKYAN